MPKREGFWSAFRRALSPPGARRIGFEALEGRAMLSVGQDGSNLFRPVFSGLLTTFGVTRISTSSAGAQSNGGSSPYSHVFSPDGSKIAFDSYASNLVPGDTNGRPDIFVKDLLTGVITRVNTDANGGQGYGWSSDPAFSPDGSKIAFESSSSNLAPDDTNETYDIFVKDLATGAITRVSTNAAGGEANHNSYDPVFSPDGTTLAFSSNASNLVVGDTNGVSDIFVKDLVTGAITRISTDADGRQAEPWYSYGSSYPAFSPDGSKVAFESYASNLVPGDTNNQSDIFLKNLANGEITRVSTSAAGAEGEYASFSPRFSPDGLKLVFYSTASNLVPGDTNDQSDVFVKDLVTGAISRVSTSAAAGQGNGGSYKAAFSPAGAAVAFESSTTNLVSRDENVVSDIFVKDLVTGAISRVSINAAGVEGNGGSYGPTFSPDGLKMAFTSDATNLVTGDTNGAREVFVASLGFMLSVTEGSTAVATLAATDRDSTATLTYSISGTDASLFTVDVATGAVSFGSTPSFATPRDTGADNVYDIQISVTDGFFVTTAPVRITVTASNNLAPTDISLSGSIVSENQPDGTVVGALSSSDPDLDNTFTYSFVSGAGSADNASFRIDGNLLKTAARLDFEAKSSYSVRVRSTDQGRLFTEKSFTITVRNVNEAPSGSSWSVATPEATAYAFATGDFAFTDPSDTPANSLLAVRITTLPATGTLTNDGTPVTAESYVTAAAIAARKLVYTPAVNATGLQTFTFQLRDDGGTADGGIDLDPTPRTMAVSITPVNQGNFFRPLFSGLSTSIDVVRASTNAAGGQGNNESFSVAFSPDGSRVAFDSDASNLVPGDTNGSEGTDIFVKDLLTGTITRVSTSALGEQANDWSFAPVFSPDGSKVAFHSYATDLVPGDTNNAYDIFVKNLVDGAITRVSTDATGGQGNEGSFGPVFSPDGSRIVFDSYASNLVPGDTNGRPDIFVKDLVTDAITRVNTDAAGVQGNNSVTLPSFSPDGSKVVFASLSSNLVPGDTNGTWDIFMKDLVTGGIRRVSTDAAGKQSNGGSFRFALSPDGSKIAFESEASNLVPGDTNVGHDVFVKDLATGSITRINITAAGQQADGSSVSPVFSPDGSKVAFVSSASNLVPLSTNVVPGGPNGRNDIFIKDLATGSVTRVNSIAPGGASNGLCYDPRFSLDGSKLAFLSDASNLVPGDTDGFYDVFVTSFGFMLSVMEGSTAVATLAATDRDAAATLTYSISGTDASLFTIDAATGAVRFASAPNFTSPGDAGADNVYAIQVSVTDGLFTTTVPAKITVTPKNETPTDISLLGASVAENQPAGTVVGALSSIDPDAGDTFTYTLPSGEGSADNASFRIDGNLLKTAARLDFESQGSYTVVVRSTDQGQLFMEKAFTITVRNVNEPPAGSSWSVATPEAAPYAFSTGDFGFTDPSDTPANSLLAVSIVTPPATGTLTIDGVAVTAESFVTAADIAARKLVYTPAANATGSQTFTFRVQDDGGTADGGIDLDPTPRTMTVSITPVSRVITLAVSPTSVTEDGTAALVYTFTRSGPTTSALTVRYTVGGTAALGTDYTGIAATPANKTVTFTVGSATATVTVDPTGDATIEPDETVILTVTAGTGYVIGAASEAIGTISNDDLPVVTVAVSPPQAREDGTAKLVYAFTRTGPTTNSLTVSYTVGGTATLDTDYTGIAATPSTKTVTFAAGSSRATVTVDPTGDATVEPDETVILTLDSAVGYTIGTAATATGTIVNDDLPVVTLAVSPTSVTEDGSANLVYTFTRTGPTTDTLTVNYRLGGTAALGTDYTGIAATPAAKSITFAAGSATATVTADPTGDATVEPDETVILTLAAGTGYAVGTKAAVTGTIRNDDFPVITLAVSPTSVTENGTANLIYTFTRTGSTAKALTVSYTVGGTATLGTDYTGIAATPAVKTVTFAAGSAKATVKVDPTGDATVEPDETVILTLAAGTGYTIGTTTGVTGTIGNDDVSTVAMESRVKRRPTVTSPLGSLLGLSQQPGGSLRQRRAGP